MRMRLLLGCLAVVSSCCGLAGAQTAPSLHVVVDDLSKDAGACGIDGPSIESAAMRTLRDHDIRVVANLASPYSYLYVAAKVMSVPSVGAAPLGCVVDTHVEVVGVSPTQAPVGGFKGPKARRGRAEVILCSSAGTSNGSPPDLGTYFMRELEQRIKLCLGNLT